MNKNFMTRDDIARTVKGVVGRGLQEPKRGIISSLNTTSTDAYTVLVKVAGQEEETEVLYDPVLFAGKLSINLPVRIALNEDNRLEIISIDTIAAQEALQGEFPEVSVTGVIPMANGGTGADLSGSAQGGIPNVDADGNLDILPIGTSGQVLTNDGTNILWGAGITTPLDVADGGTGRSTLTANSILYGNGTSPIGMTASPSGGSSSVLYWSGTAWAPAAIITLLRGTMREGFTINDDAAAAGDFRAESISNTHMLFLDSSANSIGLNNSTPSANTTLDIVPASGDSAIRLGSSNPLSAANGDIYLKSTDGKFRGYANGAEVELGLPSSVSTGVMYTNGLGWSSVTTIPSLIFSSYITLTSATAPSLSEGRTWNDSTNKMLQSYTGGITQRHTGTLFSLTTVQTIANTATVTRFTVSGNGEGTITLPADFLTVGKTIRITAAGYYTSTGSPTLAFEIDVPGAVSILATGAVTVGASGSFFLEALMECYSTGAPGTVWTQGTARVGTTITDVPTTATQNITTTSTNNVGIVAAWSAADASNSATLTHFNVKVE